MTVSSLNQIQCTAERLGQLRPEMLKAVAQGSAFDVGQQYFSERRVRILRADNEEIASEVTGAGGLYQQTIALTEGVLVTKCSCPSKERPLCRHCVAVLLEYHRLNPDGPRGPAAYSPKSAGPNTKGAARDALPSESGGLEVRLREIAIFLEWMQAAVHAVNDDRPLPQAPPGFTGSVLQGVQAMQRLDERASRGEEETAALRADLRAQRDQLDGMARELNSAKLEVERCRGIVRTLLEKEREWSHLATMMQGMTSDMIKKAADVDRLVAGLKNQGGSPT